MCVCVCGCVWGVCGCVCVCGGGPCRDGGRDVPVVTGVGISSTPARVRGRIRNVMSHNNELKIAGDWMSAAANGGFQENGMRATRDRASVSRTSLTVFKTAFPFKSI